MLWIGESVRDIAGVNRPGLLSCDGCLLIRAVWVDFAGEWIAEVLSDFESHIDC